MKHFFKARWKRRGRLKGDEAAGIDGARRLALKPDPVLREITLDIAESGLGLLGVDIEDFLAGRHVSPIPPIKEAGKFFEVVLENHDRYDLASMPFDLASGAVTVVASAFFFECARLAGRLSLGKTGR